VPRLVPLVATCGREFVDALSRAWDAGDAVLPVDPRLPAAAADALATAMRAGEDVDDGDALVMATSEIHLRGPVLLRCYRDGTDPTTPDGWFPTGDAGWVDDDGVLHVDGRLTDLIVTGGENVWPVAVERSLRTHAAIADCVVAGRPDAEWGECVVAWVVLAPGARDAPPLDDLRDHVKADLAPWCAPKEIHVVDELPRTASGKVRRPGHG
jgi:O-succinylbenzoic acid--CoA ligase